MHTAWQKWTAAYQTGMQQYWADIRQVGKMHVQSSLGLEFSACWLNGLWLNKAEHSND